MASPNNKDKPLTRQEVVPYTEGAGSGALTTPLPAHLQELQDILNTLTDEVKQRLQDPKQIKRIDTVTLLERIEGIARVLKATAPTIIAKKFEMNWTQVSDRARAINGSPTRRQELREEVTKRLRNFPS